MTAGWMGRSSGRRQPGREPMSDLLCFPQKPEGFNHKHLLGTMTTIVKIHRKGQMTLPCRLRSALGIAEGDLVEATVQRGKLVITPKVVIDRSRFPSAQDEYTLPSVAGLTAAFPKARKNTSRAGPLPIRQRRGVYRLSCTKKLPSCAEKKSKRAAK